VHDISFARYPKYIDLKDLLILKLFIKKSLKRADKVIAVSQFTKDEIVDVYKVANDKIKVIYNGGVAKEFKENIKKDKLLDFRTKYGIMKPYLLFLGTLQPRKNIAFLIEAFIELKIKYSENVEVKDLTLVLRGKRGGHNYDDRIDDILKIAKKSYPDIRKQIKFIGYVSNEDVPLIFNGATAFCFTSIYEGFGLPLLESMSVETPVIANSSSCFPEIINDAGIIYKTGSKNDWVASMKELLTNSPLQEKLIDKGKKRVEFFSWSKNAKQTIELYSKVVKDQK
jgi:glycosyltransferase involved in cell wall biosynthesis